MFFFDMAYGIPQDTRYLARVWVRPHLRGEGIGRALIRCAESFAGDSGATRLFAACVPHNGAMRRLFAELGWSYQMRVDYRRAGPGDAVSSSPGRRTRAKRLVRVYGRADPRGDAASNGAGNSAVARNA